MIQKVHLSHGDYVPIYCRPVCNSDVQLLQQTLVGGVV